MIPAITSSISIHAPLTRCDISRNIGSLISTNFNPRTSYEVRLEDAMIAAGIMEFQSTHLLRGATALVRFSCLVDMISIHAPLTRCDFRLAKSARIQSNFNPRTSYEVRHGSNGRDAAHGRFQSTHLLRGATDGGAALDPYRTISIHAPLTRCDGCGQGACSLSIYFNPRTSYEVRPGTLRRRG